MSYTIPLTQGYTATVDDEDYELVSQYVWHAHRSKVHVYVVTKPGKQAIFLHRLILDAKIGEQVDHINGDTLDNRRSNLRICTQSQNIANQKVRLDTKTGFKGVSLSPRRNDIRYRSHIEHHGNRYHLGYFTTPEEAARAYDSKAIELHGDFAHLNFPSNHAGEDA